MSKDTHIVAKIVEWLDANVEEQSLPYEVRLESAKLRDRIETLEAKVKTLEEA